MDEINAPFQVVIDTEPLKEDDGSCLICQTRDGLLHRVMPMPYPACRPSKKQKVVRATRRLLHGRKYQILVETE